MASEYKGLYVSFEGDSSKLTAALSQINSASRSAQSSLRGVQNALKLDPGSTKLLGAAMEAAGRKVDATRQRVDVLRQAQDELAKSGDTTSAAYQRVSRELAQAEAYLRRDQRALVDATNAASGFGAASRHLDAFASSAQALSGKLTGIGTGLTMGVTAPLAAIAGASIAAETTIDTALTNVRKTTDLTEQQYQQLRDAAIESSTTQPVTADQILNMEALGAQLGWSRDALQQFADVANGLDIATDMDAERAGTNLAQFANITKMAQGDAERYASSIVGLGNNMATTESKISDMAMGMASAGAQAGMSQADILGVAAAAASLGMEAQAGGSAFSKTINEIGMQVSTNGKQLEQWASLAHMSVDEFKSAWSSDVTGTFEAVVRGMGEVSANGGDLNATLSDLGITELRQSDFMRRLAGNSELLGKAVSLSNSEWERNTALQNEVDNRNQSLASKMQVLQNRVTAVAADLGGPLADAALAAVDAAKPITDAVEGAAKAFSSMSKEERQGVIQTLALAAAAGPMLTIAGKAVGVAGSVAGGLSGVAKGSGQLVAALKVAHGTTGGLADKLGALSSGLGLANAKSVLLGGGIMVAVAAVAALGVAVYDHVKTGRDFAAELDKMRGNADGVSESLASGARSVSDWGGKAQESAKSTKELTQALREHNEKMSGIRDSAHDSVAMLGQYQSVIDRLAGSHEASAEDTAMLDWALKGLNDTLGTSYTVADVLTGEYEDQSGAVVNLRDEIDKLIKKKQEEARVNATQSLYTEALENQMRAQKDAAAAQEEYSRKYDELYAQETKLNDARPAWNKSSEEQKRHTVENTLALQGYKDKLDSANQSLSAANDEVPYYAQQMGLAQVACTEAGKAMADFLSGTDGWVSALSGVGLSMDELAGAAASAGVSTDTLASLGADNFAKLAASAGGNVDVLIQTLSTLNQLHLDPKTFSVNEDGTLTDSTDKVWDLQNMTIDGKEFSVSDEGTIAVKGTELENLSAQQVADKPFVTTSHGTTQAETGNAEDLRNKLNQIPGSYDAYVNAHTATAESNVDSLSGKLWNLVHTGWTAVVHTVTGNAMGGINRHAVGGVRMHATGGAVYTRSTLIGPNDIIGEAGPEWYDGTNIVPLTSRYSAPFAGTIADALIERLGRMGADTKQAAPAIVVNGITFSDQDVMSMTVLDLMGRIDDVREQYVGR